MDLMTFYTCIAAVAAAASAIIAWTARADSLRAQEAASTAQNRATEIAEKSAEALDRANELAEKHYSDRVALERRSARAKWASLLRGWMMSKFTKATLPDGAVMPSAIRRITAAEVSDARFELDDPSAEVLQGAIFSALNKLADGIKAMPQTERQDHLLVVGPKLVACEILIESWVTNPKELSLALEMFEAESGE